MIVLNNALANIGGTAFPICCFLAVIPLAPAKLWYTGKVCRLASSLIVKGRLPLGWYVSPPPDPLVVIVLACV